MCQPGQGHVGRMGARLPGIVTPHIIADNDRVEIHLALISGFRQIGLGNMGDPPLSVERRALGIQAFAAGISVPHALAPHLAKPDGDVDPRNGGSGVPIGGGGKRPADNAGKQGEDFLRQKARTRCEDVTTTMPVLLGSIKAPRLREIKVFPRPRHRHVE